MVKHVVTFQFSGSPSERMALSTSFREALVQLPYVIPELKSIEVGINENPAEKWDMCLTACVDTLDDVAAYSAHPAHQNAVAIIRDHPTQRACVDYSV